MELLNALLPWLTREDRQTILDRQTLSRSGELGEDQGFPDLPPDGRYLPILWPFFLSCSSAALCILPSNARVP